MDRRASYNKTLLGFLLLSVVVHLLLLYLFQDRSLFPLVKEPERVYVEVREPERRREFDLPPQPPQQRETPAKRLGPVDREVPKEVAPKGEAPDERLPQPAVKPSRPSPPPATPKPTPPQKKTVVEPSRPVTEPPLTVSPSGERPMVKPSPEPLESSKPPQPKAPQPRVPDIRRLTQLAPNTIARLQQERRHKYRREVEEGNAVWLDMEQDLLFSFFKRLRENIYLVWQYPEVARQNRIEGTCLLEMVINRDGSVRGVQVLESSGSRALDEEAVEAVWKGAPYGKLPRVYEKDTIRILANFVYTIRNRVIY